MTCALATGSSYSMPASGRPSTTIGSPPSVAVERRPHPAERLDDPPHRPARERLVADELEPSLLEGEHARDQADERPGVPAVDRRVRGPEAAQPGAVDDEGVLVLLVDLHAE